MKSDFNTHPLELRKQSRALDVEIGQSIRYHRKKAQMSMQTLARSLGIAYQQVQKYETGVNRIGAGRLMTIAEILDVPVVKFFEGDYARMITAMVPDTDALHLGRQLLISFLRIDDINKRKAALDCVREFAEPETSRSLADTRTTLLGYAQVSRAEHSGGNEE
jgi:transcriptional regulator with XRE-family HTH domain